jgi:hypothetical protein
MRTKFLKDPLVGLKIKITYCWSRSPNYDNLKPETIHEVIHSPFEGVNSLNRVWVKGNPDPALLLKEEFIFLRRRTK